MIVFQAGICAEKLCQILLCRNPLVQLDCYIAVMHTKLSLEPRLLLDIDHDIGILVLAEVDDIVDLEVVDVAEAQLCSAQLHPDIQRGLTFP